MSEPAVSVPGPHLEDLLGLTNAGFPGWLYPISTLIFAQISSTSTEAAALWDIWAPTACHVEELFAFHCLPSPTTCLTHWDNLSLTVSMHTCFLKLFAITSLPPPTLEEIYESWCFSGLSWRRRGEDFDKPLSTCWRSVTGVMQLNEACSSWIKWLSRTACFAQKSIDSPRLPGSVAGWAPRPCIPLFYKLTNCPLVPPGCPIQYTLPHHLFFSPASLP